MQEGHSIAFVSKALGPRQLALSAYEKKLMAIVYVVIKCKHYLQGKQFLIRTDYSSLKFLLDQKTSHVAQYVQLIKLLGFDYEIEYKKGKDNLATDAILRVFHNKLCALTLSSISTNIMEKIRKTWKTDQNLQQLITKLSKDANSYHNYSWVNDTFIQKEKVVVGQDLNLQNQLINLYHDSTMGGIQELQ